MVSRSELISSSKSSAYHAVERIECNTCYIRIYHDVPPVDVSKVTKQLFFITSLANRCVLYKRINGAILKMLWKYTDLKSTVRSDAKFRTKYSKVDLDNLRSRIFRKGRQIHGRFENDSEPWKMPAFPKKEPDNCLLHTKVA